MRWSLMPRQSRAPYNFLHRTIVRRENEGYLQDAEAFTSSDTLRPVRTQREHRLDRCPRCEERMPKAWEYTHHIFTKNSKPVSNRAVTGCVCVGDRVCVCIYSMCLPVTSLFSHFLEEKKKGFGENTQVTLKKREIVFLSARWTEDI